VLGLLLQQQLLLEDFLRRPGLARLPRGPGHWSRDIGAGTLEPGHWSRDIGAGTLGRTNMPSCGEVFLKILMGT